MPDRDVALAKPFPFDGTFRYELEGTVIAIKPKIQRYQGEADEGRALLARAPVVNIATTGDDGRPILHTVHAVLDGDLLAFHGASAGEKMEGLGRRAVAGARETVAEIPSWFFGSEAACTTTTYYVSAEVDGVLEEVTDPVAKARILQRLMQKLQPEGGHAPARADDPRYAKAVRDLLIAGVRITHLACKAKLGQNRSDEERASVIAQLWLRGGPGDVAAVDLLIRRFPELAPPVFRSGELTFSCALANDDELTLVLALLDDAYWLTAIPVERRRSAIRASSVALARDATGTIVAFARATTDSRTAWIYDVIVAASARKSGIGTALFRFLLDHPTVRHARNVRLSTRDAMDFYRRFGFVDIEVARSKRPWRSTEMMLNDA